MAINYDQRAVKNPRKKVLTAENRDFFNRNLQADYGYASGDYGLDGYEGLNFDQLAQKYGVDDPDYDFANEDRLRKNGLTAWTGGYGPENGFGNYDLDTYSNRELYDAYSKDNTKNISEYLRLPGLDGLLNGPLAYDSSKDYRDAANIFGSVYEKIPIFKEAQQNIKTERRKAFQAKVLAGSLAFVTAGIGSALTAPAAAAGTGTGAAVGGSGVGAAGGAVAGGAPAAAGGGFFVGPGGFIGNIGSTLGNTIANSAIQSGLSSLIQGQNPLTGALKGGLTGGIGNLTSGLDFGFGDTFNDFASGAIRGGVGSAVSGGNPFAGALTSGLTSGAGSVLNNGFQFSGADTPTGGGGFSLPDDYYDAGQAFQNSIGGNNVSDFGFGDFDGGNYDFSNSIGDNPFGDFQGNVGDSLFGDLSNTPGDSIFNLNPDLNQFFGGPTGDGLLSGNSEIDNFLNAYYNPNQTLDLSNSGGPNVNIGDQGGSSGIASLVSRFGPGVLRALLGGGGGGSGGGGLAGLLRGGGRGPLGGIATGILSNSQRQALEGARDRSVALADPFASQRPRYQEQLRRLTDNPGSISSSPAFQGIFDLGLEGVNRTASARGQLSSGNRLAALSDYGQKTASQYYFPQANLLSNLAGANSGSPSAAAEINFRGTGDAQGLRTSQVGGFLDGISGLFGGGEDTALQGILRSLSDRGI